MVFPTNTQMYKRVTLVHLLPIHIGGDVGHCFHTHLDVFAIWRQNEALWEPVTPELNWESCVSRRASFSHQVMFSRFPCEILKKGTV